MQLIVPVIELALSRKKALGRRNIGRSARCRSCLLAFDGMQADEAARTPSHTTNASEPLSKLLLDAPVTPAPAVQKRTCGKYHS